MNAGVHGLLACAVVIVGPAAWCQTVEPLVHEAAIDAPLAEALHRESGSH